MLKPRTQAPELEVNTLDGGIWKLSEQKPEKFTMIVFYRGLHCPVCKGYLGALSRTIEDFRSRGVEVIAISGDTRERAEQSHREWGLENVPIGYGQSIDSIREWGLFVSPSIKEEEPDLFGEPGLFLIRPDGTVYYESIQSMPFGRPAFQEMLGAIDFVTQADYPARGEA
jgi:alkyl hydroperoxide reductase subunit AhpC